MHTFVPAAVPIDAVFVSVIQRKLVRFPMRNSNVEKHSAVLQLLSANAVAFGISAWGNLNVVFPA
jgi:hypothetical protein